MVLVSMTAKHSSIKRLLKYLLIAVILTQLSAGKLFAHGEDFRTVEVIFNVPAVPNSFIDKQGRLITLTNAYLSSFSIQLISCDVMEEKSKANVVMNIVDWLLPPVYANHSVKLNAPGQMPIKVIHPLLKGSTVAVGSFNIAVGRYCSINYTMGNTGKKSDELASELTQQFSLLLSVQNNGEQSESQQHLSASYAYGKDIPIDLIVSARDTINSRASQLNLTLDVAEALKQISFEQNEHMVVRDLLFEIPKHLSAVVTNLN